MPSTPLLSPVQQNSHRAESTMGTGRNSRNSEKRRERSKVAARDRRSKESEIFSELSQYLPLPEPTRNSLDKASVMRLSLSDLKLRAMMEKVSSGEPNGSRNNIGKELESELGTLLNNAMGGFLLVLSTDGDIIYVSESVTTHLGLSQVEVMGLNIYDFSHPCDHADIRDLLFVNKKDANEDIGRSGSFRMKCTITERGRNVHIRAATYKLIDFTGRMLPSIGDDETGRWFVSIGEPLLHPSDVDIPLNKQTFLTKHIPDMKCEFVDDSIGPFLGYRPEDLIGKSIFEFHHASDGPALAKAFKSLYVKGQSVTERYRFLAKHGGWVWVVTQATLIPSNSGMKTNSIVCLNFITSGIENEDEIVSGIQQERPACRPFTVITPNFKNSPSFVTPVNSPKEQVLEKERQKENILPHIISAGKPIPSTTKIFAPRTDDMDSGFLMPCDDRLIVSKEEPEDLTHLAPIAGDESVPLALPLLDNLLKSLDGANMEYTLSNFIIDVNADDLPPLLEEQYSTDTDDQECISMKSSSPLFLHGSDPHMPMVGSPGSKSSLLSPFQQLSPSQSYASSTMSPGDLHSPYSLGGESASNYDSSQPSIPALVSMQEVPSAILFGRHWAINPGGTDTISANDYRSHSPMGIHFSSSESESPPVSSMMSLLPLNDTGEFMVLGQLSPTLSNDTGELLSLQDFNVSNNSLTRVLVCGSETQHQFPFDTKENNSKNIDMHSDSCSSDFTSGITRSTNEEVGRDKWNWDPTITQKRPHQVFSIKSEITDSVFDSISSSTGPRLAKQPKLTGPSPSTLSTDENQTNIPSPTVIAYTKTGDISGEKLLCTNNKEINDVPTVVNSTLNDHTTSQSIKAGEPPTLGPTPLPLPPPVESGKGFAEIDLKAYIQNLLSSGRSDIINALFSELSNYRKECNLNQTTTDANTVTTTSTKIMAANSEKSETGESSVLTQDKSQGTKGLHNPKRDNQENTSLITVIGLDTAKTLVELTTFDCEVNAPANEGSSHLHASELVKDLDQINQNNFL